MGSVSPYVPVTPAKCSCVSFHFVSPGCAVKRRVWKEGKACGLTDGGFQTHPADGGEYVEL